MTHIGRGSCPTLHQPQVLTFLIFSNTDEEFHSYSLCPWRWTGKFQGFWQETWKKLPRVFVQRELKTLWMTWTVCVAPNEEESQNQDNEEYCECGLPAVPPKSGLSPQHACKHIQTQPVTSSVNGKRGDAWAVTSSCVPKPNFLFLCFPWNLYSCLETCKGKKQFPETLAPIMEPGHVIHLCSLTLVLSMQGAFLSFYLKPSALRSLLSCGELRKPAKWGHFLFHHRHRMAYCYSLKKP